MAENLQQIEQLYHEALKLLPNEREDFLKAACKGDDSLLMEVKSLLIQETEPTDFLERPLIELFAKAVARASGMELTQELITPGQTIAQYRILEKIGVGNMSVVFKALDTDLQRFVALKFLPKDLAADQEALQRFRREAQAASKLNNPNICTVYALGMFGDQPFIVMEFLDGITLKQHISCRPMDFNELLSLAVEIADALETAHSRGIIHCDIKSTNILVTREGRIKVLDFGLAKLLKPQLVNSPDATEDLERSIDSPGTILGTPAYMSPEQIRGERVDERTDLFSFGAVLYEMATGSRAFPGLDIASIIAQVTHDSPPPVRRSNPSIPSSFEALVSKALEKDPSHRYQTAAELRAELRRLLRVEIYTGSRTPSKAMSLVVRAARLWRQRARWLATAAILFLAGTLTVQWTKSSPTDARNFNDRGVDLQRQGKLQAAIDNYHRAISLNASYAEAHYNLADAYEEIPDYDKAVAEYQRAIDADSKFYPAYENLSRLYILRLRDYATALRLLDRELALKPEEPSVQYSLHKNYGWANFELRHFTLAKRELNIAVGLDPGRGSAHCLMAKVLDAQGDELSAQAEWETCLAFSAGPDVEPEWRVEARDQIAQSGCDVAQAFRPCGRPADIAVSISGSVSFKRQRWKTFVPLAFGTILQFGDLLRVDDASHLKIVCSNLTLHEVSSGMSGVPCPDVAGVQNTEPNEMLRASDGSPIYLTRYRDAEPRIPWGFPPGNSERKTAEEQERRIATLGLPSGATLFLTAYLYRSNGLESEAILKLEAALKSSREPEIARVLGDCYRRWGFMRKAEEAYLTSLSMEGAGADTEGQMLAHLRLGVDIYAQYPSNKEAAALHLNAALALARKVGDAIVATQAEDTLAELRLGVGRDPAAGIGPEILLQ
jgi:serine/threonine protein kinase